MVSAIILAAGQGRRMKSDINKVYLKIAKKSVLKRALSAFQNCGKIDEIIIVCRANEKKWAKNEAKEVTIPLKIIEGGDVRQQSVRNGLSVVSPDADIICVHDAARCLIRESVIKRCITAAKRTGSGVAGVMAKDTLKKVENGVIIDTVDRSGIAFVQTPQVFKRDILLKAHEQALKDGYIGTDESVLVERTGLKVTLVKSDYDNIKVTTRDDLAFLEFLLSEEKMDVKVGHGYDAHEFKEGRSLVLGGVTIPNDKGLNGHSDADVVVHAIMDALLGAAGLPDIGVFFPPCDNEFKDASSIKLLEKTAGIVKEAGFLIANVDATIVLQSPKVQEYIYKMRKNISCALSITEDQVNVKSTTTEHMGFIGRKEGAAAHAVCLIKG